MHRLHTNAALTWKTTRQEWLKGDFLYALAAATFALGSVATLAAATALHRADAASLGAMLALFRYSQMVRVPLERIAEQLPELQRTLAGATRAARLLAVEPAMVDPDDSAARALPTGALSIELDDVTLAYDKEYPALREVSLALGAGRTLGVVGRTGSGKTTLGRLLLRFWDPTEGVVRLGGVGLRQVAGADLRKPARSPPPSSSPTAPRCWPEPTESSASADSGDSGPSGRRRASSSPPTYGQGGRHSVVLPMRLRPAHGTLARSHEQRRYGRDG